MATSRPKISNDKGIVRATMFYGPGLIKVNSITQKHNATENIEKAIETHRAYDSKHGYSSFILRQPILEGVWSKPAWLLHIVLVELAKPEMDRKQWLMWYDADTIIMNDNVPLETFLPPDHLNEIHLLVCQDHNGLNNGVFFLRINPWAAVFLAGVMAFPATSPEHSLRFRDQTAMEEMLQLPAHAPHHVYVPMSWFNGYTPVDLNATASSHLTQDAFKGCLLVHLAGSKQKRHFHRWLKLASERAWSLPLQETHYENETASFWQEYERFERS